MRLLTLDLNHIPGLTGRARTITVDEERGTAGPPIYTVRTDGLKPEVVTDDPATAVKHALSKAGVR